VSDVSVDLYGAINANDVMDITITNSNSSTIELDLYDVYGDIDSINSNSGSEGASTYIGVSTAGSIKTVNLTTNQDAETIASFDIAGPQNFIENLTITNIGTSYFGDYTSVSDVKVNQGAHGGIVNIVNGPTNGNLLSDTRLTYDGNFQADSIVIAANNNDGPGDEFALHISMDDVDVFDTQHQTALVNNMTTITGLTNGYDNPTNNYIQFADLEDADYTYEPGAIGRQGPIDLNISHYSNGLDGWVGGLGEDTVYYDDVEGSQNIGNGFYGSFNEFFDAAQYGIASEYAFIELTQYGAAGNDGYDFGYDTDVYLNVTWVDKNGNSQTIYLNTDIGDVDLAGNLAGDADRVVAGLNADTDWDGNPTGSQDASDLRWDTWDNNLTIFANDDNTLGIRIGEGYITNVQFHTDWVEVDDLVNDYTNYGSSDATQGKGYESLDTAADFGDSSIRFVEGGGYFFGMVLNTEQTAYRGVLAMDEDGEGVTKLIELADVVASYNDVDNFLDGSQSSDSGYNEFTSAYIGMAFGTDGGDWAGYPGSTGFDYYTTAGNYELKG